MAALTLKFFVSSPGDVGQERQEAERVLERLQGEFGGAVRLEPILWEDYLLQPTSDFQKQIPEPSTADVVICIFWSRLGTPLPPDYQPAEGMPSPSGTEWEFQNAYEASRKYNKPVLLVYRKTVEPHVSISDEAALLQRVQQKKALDAFIHRWFHNPDDSLKGAFHPFESLDEFADRLTKHLRPLIQKRLQERDPAAVAERAPVTWWQGSPYRGLEVFDAEHAPVFAGRTRAIGEIKESLSHRAAEHCAFLLIFGMSGGGKSSLVRAGVLPSVTQPGVIEGVGLWRRCIFLPSMAQSGDLFDALAQSLRAEQALPELEESGMDVSELAGLFRDAPVHAVTQIRLALDRAGEAARRQQGRSYSPLARLVVVVDQMEELFTRENIDAPQRERFVTLLSALALCDRVWVIATMRSDFYPRCEEIPALVALKAGGGTYHLLAPSPAEIRQMICQPAQAAGLRFEQDRDSRLGLDDVLLEAASRNSEALPLLEFTLEELFQRRSERQELTFAAYRELGGLEGALASRAEAVLTTLPEPVQAELPSLLRSLASIEYIEGDLPIRRRVPLSALAATPACQALLEAFLRARLLVIDRADNNQAVVGVAHEALLRHWPRAKERLEQDVELLRVRDRVAADAQVWQAQKRNPDCLLPAGKRLTDALALLAEWPDELDRGLVQYTEASRALETRRRWVRRGGAALIVITSIAFAVNTVRQNTKLQKQVNVTVDTIAGLSSIPQSLSGNDTDTNSVVVPLLRQMYQDNQQTLDKSPEPDSRNVRRAKAVNCLLQAELWRRESSLEPQSDKLTKADQCAADLVKQGLQLTRERGSLKEQALDERNLALFFLGRGRILEDMAYDERNDQRYDEALAADAQGVTYATLARQQGDPEALQVLCYAYLRTAHLHQAMAMMLQVRNPPDLSKSRQHYQAMAVTSEQAVTLADQWATQGRNDEAVRSLAAGNLLKAEALDADGDWARSRRDWAGATGAWTQARAAYQESQNGFSGLVRGDPETLKILDDITARLQALEQKLKMP